MPGRVAASLPFTYHLVGRHHMDGQDEARVSIVPTAGTRRQLLSPSSSQPGVSYRQGLEGGGFHAKTGLMNPRNRAVWPNASMPTFRWGRRSGENYGSRYYSGVVAQGRSIPRPLKGGLSRVPGIYESHGRLVKLSLAANPADDHIGSLASSYGDSDSNWSLARLVVGKALTLPPD